MSGRGRGRGGRRPDQGPGYHRAERGSGSQGYHHQSSNGAGQYMHGANPYDQGWQMPGQYGHHPGGYVPHMQLSGYVGDQSVYMPVPPVNQVMQPQPPAVPHPQDLQYGHPQMVDPSWALWSQQQQAQAVVPAPEEPPPLPPEDPLEETPTKPPGTSESVESADPTSASKFNSSSQTAVHLTVQPPAQSQADPGLPVTPLPTTKPEASVGTAPVIDKAAAEGSGHKADIVAPEPVLLQQPAVQKVDAKDLQAEPKKESPPKETTLSPPGALSISQDSATPSSSAEKPRIVLSKPTAQTIVSPTPKLSPAPKPLAPQAFSMIIKSNQPIVKKNVLVSRSKISVKPLVKIATPEAGIVAGASTPPSLEKPEGSNQAATPPSLGKASQPSLPSFTIPNTAPKREPKASNRTTTRWGKDLPVTALSPASPPQNPRPSPLVSAHIPPAVNPASPGDPTSPPQTKASPVLPDLAKPPVLAEPDLAKPSVLEEPAIPPPVKAGSPDGPSSPTEAQQNSRRSRSASHRADRGSPPARRRDHRDRRPESRERSKLRSPRSRSDSLTSPHGQSRSRHPLDRPSRLGRRYSRSPSRYGGRRLHSPMRRDIREPYEYQRDQDRSHRGRGHASQSYRDHSRRSPGYRDRYRDPYGDARNNHQRHRDYYGGRSRSPSRSRRRRSHSRDARRHRHHRGRSQSYVSGSEDGEVGGAAADRLKKQRETSDSPGAGNLADFYEKIRGSRQAHQEAERPRPSRFAAKDFARQDTSGARPGPKDAQPKATKSDHWAAKHQLEKPYSKPDDRAAEKRQKELNAIKSMNERLKAKLQGVFKHHKLGEPALNITARCDQIKRLQGQMFNLKNPNLILTLDASLEREYKEAPANDLSVIGDPRPFGMKTWSPDPLTLLDHIPKLPEPGEWSIYQETHYFEWSPKPQLATDPRKEDYIQDFVEPHPMALPHFATLTRPERPAFSKSHSWAGDASDLDDDAYSAVPPPPDGGPPLDPAGLVPPPPPAENAPWVGAPPPVLMPPMHPAGQPPPHPGRGVRGPAPPIGNPRPLQQPAVAEPPKRQRLEPEQTNDWRWITNEGGLAKTSLSLETLRTGSRESGAEKGPCAYRQSDNLWLPVNQNKFHLKDLAWKGADELAGSRQPGADAKGLREQAVAGKLTVPERRTRPVATAPRSKVDSAARLQALVNSLMGGVKKKASLAEMEQRSITCQQALRKVARLARVEQPSKKRKLEQGSQASAWGPKPPVHVPAMLKGRLALRLLSGKEGETLVAKLVETAFEKALVTKAERDKKENAKRKKEEQERQLQEQKQRKIRQLQEEEQERKRKELQKQQEANHRKQKAAEPLKPSGRVPDAQRKVASGAEGPDKPGTIDLAPVKDEQVRSQAGPVQISPVKPSQPVEPSSTQPVKHQQGEESRSGQAVPPTANGRKAAAQPSAQDLPARVSNEERSSNKAREHRQKRKIVDSDSDDDYDPTGVSRPPKLSKRAKRAAVAGNATKAGEIEGEDGDEDVAISDVDRPSSKQPQGSKKAEEQRSFAERLRANMYKSKLPELVEGLLSHMKSFDRKECNDCFAKPVKQAEYPDYHNRITQPMDLATLTQKWGKGNAGQQVFTLQDLGTWKRDMLLICQNARDYLEANSLPLLDEAIKKFEPEFERVYEAQLTEVNFEVEQLYNLNVRAG